VRPKDVRAEIEKITDRVPSATWLTLICKKIIAWHLGRPHVSSGQDAESAAQFPVFQAACQARGWTLEGGVVHSWRNAKHC